jgi:hypothetical protein
LDRALGVLLDGVAMRGSLRSCPEALSLEDVLDTRGLVLFSLDVADYPHATRKVASRLLLGMGRLARQLAQADTVGAKHTQSDRAPCSWSTRSARWAVRQGICEGWWDGRARLA